MLSAQVIRVATYPGIGAAKPVYLPQRLQERLLRLSPPLHCLLQPGLSPSYAAPKLRRCRRCSFCLLPRIRQRRPCPLCLFLCGGGAELGRVACLRQPEHARLHVCDAILQF